MKRLVVLLVLAALATAVPAADDFQAFRDSFRAAFGLMPGMGEPTAEDRLAAVESLATFKNEDSTRLLILGVRLEQERIEALQARRELIRTGRDRSLRGALPGPHLLALKKQIDAEYRVLETIEEALSRLSDRDAIAYLASGALLRNRFWKCRTVAARALGAIGQRERIPALVKGLGDRDPRVRTAVVLSLGAMRSEEALADLLKMLKDRDWTVRSAAVDALGKILDPRAFEPLLALMERERGRLAADCAEVLKKLTGEDFGVSPAAWRSWWKDHKKRVLAGRRPPARPRREKPGEDDARYYHGIPVNSARTVFIIDVSESMSYSSTEFTKKPKEGELSRFELAKRELIRAVRNYSPKSTFDLIAFHTVVKVWRPRMVPATPAMKKDAVDWINTLRPIETTNIYAALEAAFRLGGMGVGDRYYEPRVDTIYLLSDGAPTNRDRTDDDPERILRAVREWNRLGRIRIHTIGLKGHSADFMSRLARENGGTYTVRE